MRRGCMNLKLAFLAGLCLIASTSQGANRPGSLTTGADAPEPGSAVEVAGDATGVLDRTMPTPPMLPGWPKTMATHLNFKPCGIAIADVDGDGDLEVLAGSTDNLFRVWHHDGTLLPGWPVNVGGQVQSKAAIGDLDGDGDLEILIATRAGQVRAYHHDATPISGWPQPSGSTLGFRSPVLYDLDADGRPEVMIGGGTTVLAWRGDGTLLPGFPRTVTGTISGTLAVGDITGDGIPEMFVVATAGFLHALRPDGTDLPGWPASFGLSNSYAAPSIGDIDGDGLREVLVVGYQFGVLTRIFAYRGDASLMPGFPITHPSAQTYTCPVLADLDHDGDLEILNGGKISGPSLYAWDHQGAILPGWPVAMDPNQEGSPIVADLDGDPGLEIAIGDNMGPGFLYGFESDGQTSAGFPWNKPGASGPNSPAIADVDVDGDLEIAMTMMDGTVAIWDLAVPFTADRIEWGNWFHDNWNTNQYGFRVPGSPASAGEGDATARLRLAGASPNPFHPPIRVTLQSDGIAYGSLRVHDAAGRSVRPLFEGIVGRGARTVTWDGRDDEGRSLPAGVYFLRFQELGRASETVRVVLVR